MLLARSIAPPSWFTAGLASTAATGRRRFTTGLPRYQLVPAAAARASGRGRGRRFGFCRDGRLKVNRIRHRRHRTIGGGRQTGRAAVGCLGAAAGGGCLRDDRLLAATCGTRLRRRQARRRQRRRQASPGAATGDRGLLPEGRARRWSPTANFPRLSPPSSMSSPGRRPYYSLRDAREGLTDIAEQRQARRALRL